MALVIRNADLNSDRESLIQCLDRHLDQHLTRESGSRRFDWLYRNNPHGRARVWMAIDSNTNMTVGMAAAFPRMVYIASELTLASLLGDFCISREYRSLGPAVHLQRACLTGINWQDTAFCYDFPSPTMMAVYKRIGIRTDRQMVRLAKPLSVDRKVRELVKVPLLASLLTSAGNYALSLRENLTNGSSSCQISFQKPPCDTEFTALAEKTGSQHGACVQRSAEYLNWRYFAHPSQHYEILTSRRNGILLAYAVFLCEGEQATLVDLFGLEEPPLAMDLIRQLVSVLRRRGVATLSAPMIESHPWIPLMKRLGFSKREAKPVMIYAPNGALRRTRMSAAANWFLLCGDRDS